MEIDFNPSRAAKADPSQTVARSDAAAPATDEASFQKTTALQDKLNNLPDVRPEQVARGKSLLADSEYPPSDIMDRIAILIANNILS